VTSGNDQGGKWSQWPSGISIPRPTILELEREGPSEHGIWTWKLNGDLFEISVQSRGFTQYLCREPAWSQGQRLSVEERGGLSFAEQGFSATPT
jgi:hypothetical protein